MKKICLFIIGLIGLVVCSVAQQQVSITGNGSYNGWQDGDKLVLRVNGETLETTIQNGKFTFSFLLEEPQYLSIEHRKGRGSASFMPAPGEQITMKTVEGKTVIEGSRLQADLERLVFEPFRLQNKRRGELFNKYREVVMKAEDPEKGKEVKKTKEYLKYAGEKDALEQSFTEELQKTIRENSAMLCTPLILTYNPAIKPSEEIYALFSEEVKKSYHGKEIRRLLDAMLLGKKAPDFTAKDANGKEYTLRELLAGHQYLLVDFWASWCGPCRKGIPEVKKFAEKYAAEGLAVVSISIDKDRAAWVKALEEEQMPWPNLLDEKNIKSTYGVKGIPSVFLINADGVVLFEKLYGEAIRQNLKQIFGK